MAEGERVATIELLDGYHAEGRAEGHVVTIDEPEDLGGTDKGTTPMRLFLVSLGGCAVITMRMYAKRKGWNLEKARVTARLTPGKGKEPTRIVQEIEIEGDLDDEQRERLRIIAGKCPVHRLLDGDVESEEKLV